MKVPNEVDIILDLEARRHVTDIMTRAPKRYYHEAFAITLVVAAYCRRSLQPCRSLRHSCDQVARCSAKEATPTLSSRLWELRAVNSSSEAMLRHSNVTSLMLISVCVVVSLFLRLSLMSPRYHWSRRPRKGMRRTLWQLYLLDSPNTSLRPH